MREIERQITPSIQKGDISAENVTNIAWAYSKTKCLSPEMFEALAVYFRDNASTLNVDQLVNAAFSMYVGGNVMLLTKNQLSLQDDMFESLAHAAVQDLPYTRFHLTQILSAFVKHPPKEVASRRIYEIVGRCFLRDSMNLYAWEIGTIPLKLHVVYEMVNPLLPLSRLICFETITSLSRLTGRS